MRIAIVGAGVSGLVAAHLLDSSHEVAVFDAAGYAGGHTNTMRVDTAPPRAVVGVFEPRAGASRYVARFPQLAVVIEPAGAHTWGDGSKTPTGGGGSDGSADRRIEVEVTSGSGESGRFISPVARADSPSVGSATSSFCWPSPCGL